ncbi:translation initiation factor IF-2 [Candidatus Parcubacteria bacterium]|nr:translation initiation factor IF-2 [Candidatus Parcubacteria bacterium]
MNESTAAKTSQATVSVPETIGVGEFAEKLGLPVTKVIGELMKNGVMATINEQIDFDTALIIGSDLGFEITPEAVKETAAAVPKRPALAAGEGVPRPPVVAVMGHVDHGKTSLLDAIRSTSVASGEAGGITQHIGAYQVKRGDRWITFLDTPGHEAFSAIRAHGAKMTDVAIIVVAADDGVKPQTKEAITHAQAAGVQLVIAINKVDKPGADPNRVKQQLSELGLVAEEWGGNTVMAEISAKNGTGIDKLLDVVLLVADLEERRALLNGPVEGMVVESHLDVGRGPVATILVQSGSLRPGDFIVSGATYAKVRNLDDFRGKRLKQATPGMPAVVSGFKAVPSFGNLFSSVKSEKEAKDAAVGNRRSEQVKSLVQVKKIGASELARAITAGRVSELGVVVKADVQGSLESLLGGLAELRSDEVGVKVVSSAVGDITESDVLSAKTAGAILVGFNVGVSSAVRQLANRQQVEVRLYKVIYELLDDVRDMLSRMLKPEVIETVVATLEVLGVFKVTKTEVICGGRVTSGKVEPKTSLRIKRGGEVVGSGTLSNLQKEKQAAKEVFEGEQCGMSVATSTPIEIGDTLEFYTTETRARTL